ncbi:hypothetical protein NFJ02_16g23820 [Pycnococcus provasolii]
MQGGDARWRCKVAMQGGGAWSRWGCKAAMQSGAWSRWRCKVAMQGGDAKWRCMVKLNGDACKVAIVVLASKNEYFCPVEHFFQATIQNAQTA